MSDKKDPNAAEDLEALADKRIGPVADWATLASLMVRLDDKSLSKEERERIVAMARAATNGEPYAVRALEREIADD